MSEMITQDDAQYAFNLVKTICTQVGPGLPATPQERNRAAVLERELQTHLGTENVVVEEVTLAPGGFLNPFPSLFLLIVVLLNLSIIRLTGVLPSGVPPAVAAIVALVLSILAPLMFTLEFFFGKEFVDRFLRQGQSQNVICSLRKPGTIAVKRQRSGKHLPAFSQLREPAAHARRPAWQRPGRYPSSDPGLHLLFSLGHLLPWTHLHAGGEYHPVHGHDYWECRHPARRDHGLGLAGLSDRACYPLWIVFHPGRESRGNGARRGR